MSRYGTFPYTVGVPYGPTGLALFRVGNFVAKSRQYGTVSLSWDNPSGAWNRIRLVRSQYGFPATHSDGKVLLVSNSGPNALGTRDSQVNSFEDDGHDDGLRLTPGKTYYYTMWVEYSTGAQIRWARGADAQAIAVEDHNYLDFLLRRLPSVFTNRDMQSDGQPSRQSSGINRFMGIFAFEVSRYRDTLEALRDVNDPDATNGLLLPSMGNQLAYQYEPEIGMRQNRVLLRNATYLAQRKGTALGLSGLVSSVTGWGARLAPIRNLLHDDNDASAKVTTGRWVTTGCTLARDITVAVPTDNTVTQEQGTFALTATATSMSISLYDDLPVGKGIPVVARANYILSAYLRSAATPRTPSLKVKWYRGNGSFISTSTVAAASATSTSAWLRAATGYVQAPDDAEFATIGVAYATTVVGEVQYIKSVQFEAQYGLYPGVDVFPSTDLYPDLGGNDDGTPSAYRPAREIIVEVRPPRTNELLNPSFEVDADHWTGTSGTIARQTTVTHERSLGAGAFTTTSTSTSAAVSTDATTLSTEKPSALSVYVRTAVGTATARIKVTYLDVGGTVLGTVLGAVTNINATDWVRLSLLDRVPEGTETTRLSVVFPDGVSGATYYVDEALVENNDLIDDYFDKRVEPESAFIEGNINIGNGRTFLYPLYATRFTRAKAIAQEAVALGTRVSLKPVFVDL